MTFLRRREMRANRAIQTSPHLRDLRRSTHGPALHRHPTTVQPVTSQAILIHRRGAQKDIPTVSDKFELQHYCEAPIRSAPVHHLHRVDQEGDDPFFLFLFRICHR